MSRARGIEIFAKEFNLPSGGAQKQHINPDDKCEPVDLMSPSA